MVDPPTPGQRRRWESMNRWICYDPMELESITFATAAEALEHAEYLIARSLVDGQWDEDTDGIYVAKITHTAKRHDIEPPEEHEGEEWFEFKMEPSGE